MFCYLDSAGLITFGSWLWCVFVACIVCFGDLGVVVCFACVIDWIIVIWRLSVFSLIAFAYV